MSSASLFAKPFEVPEPDLTPKEIIARAAALREYLRDEQEATEQRTYYSAQTHELFKQAGFYRILQPKRFGGYEFDIETFYRVVMELARGCPSTGWCFCLGAAHVLQVAALFPEEAQQEIFAANDGHFVAASRDLPAGTVTPSGDGYLVTGTWNYCSGAPHSTHFVARALLADAAGRTGGDSPNVLVAVPRADWTMLDDWHGLLGLRGSGSHSIAVKDAQVPACAWTPPTTSAPWASAWPRRAPPARSSLAPPASTLSTAARRPRTASPTKQSRTCSWSRPMARPASSRSPRSRTWPA
jgi:3-hydroxy-9,10-secoandrosta-1,3,5(10)-triene-9,17-dione monooxygenase